MPTKLKQRVLPWWTALRTRIGRFTLWSFGTKTRTTATIAIGTLLAIVNAYQWLTWAYAGLSVLIDFAARGTWHKAGAVAAIVFLALIAYGLRWAARFVYGFIEVGFGLVTLWFVLTSSGQSNLIVFAGCMAAIFVFVRGFESVSHGAKEASKRRAETRKYTEVIQVIQKAKQDTRAALAELAEVERSSESAFLKLDVPSHQEAIRSVRAEIQERLGVPDRESIEQAELLRERLLTVETHLNSALSAHAAEADAIAKLTAKMRVDLSEMEKAEADAVSSLTPTLF